MMTGAPRILSCLPLDDVDPGTEVPSMWRSPRVKRRNRPQDQAGALREARSASVMKMPRPTQMKAKATKCVTVNGSPYTRTASTN